jgi:hypothetical protein
VEVLEQLYIFTKSGMSPSEYASVSNSRKSKVIFEAFVGAIMTVKISPNP